MVVLRYAVIGVAVLAMAWPSAPQSARPGHPSPGLAGSEWRIIEIDGAKAPGAGTLRFTHTSIRGKALCNAFSGAFREVAGSIAIAGINETRMLCTGRMELERAFLDGLGRARSYKLNAGTLMLFDGDGKPLVKLSG